MIKVAYLSDYPFSVAFGGKEIQMLTYQKYINELCKNEISVSLFDFWDKKALENYDIIHLFGNSNWFYDLVKPINRKNKKIVVSPTFYSEKQWTMCFSSFVSRLIPIPNFFSYKKGFFEKADKIIVNSNAEKKQIHSIFGPLEKKISVVYNAIEKDFATFHQKENQNCFLEKFNIEPGYILSVGFMDERKNTLNLIKAFLKIYPQIQKKLVIIGNFRFIHDKNAWETLRLLKQNTDKIIHIPYLERESDLLKSAYFHCYAHVLPSILETPGISNLEALIFNKPILVGLCDPVQEYFTSYALYCQPKSVSSIAKGILSLVSTSHEKNYRGLVEENYLLEKVTLQVAQIYKDLMA